MIEKRPSEVSIAVLPFEDISPGKDNEFISEGLAEEMIGDLSRFESTRVISRNSAITFKGSDKDSRSIAGELDVRYVVRGSVLRIKDRLEVDVDLIDTSDDSILLKKNFSGPMDEIFDIQEIMSRSIVAALHLEIKASDRVRLVRPKIGDARAYEFYLRARRESYFVREDALASALDHLQSGLDIVGDNALLYAGMAHAHFQYVNIGIDGPEHLAKTAEYVEKVLEIDPMSPFGHRLKGLLAFLSGQFQESVQLFKKALEVDPYDPDSLIWLITAYVISGKTDPAVVLAERLLKVDPLTPVNQTCPGWIHFFEGRFDSAIDPIRLVYQSSPEEPLFRYHYILMLVYNGRHDEALKLIDVLADDAPDHPLALQCLVIKHSLRGRKDKVAEIMTPEFEVVMNGDPVYSWTISSCYALLGEKETALDWLEHAIDTGFINHPFLSKHDRLLDRVRGEERFDTLLARAKRRWMDFAA